MLDSGLDKKTHAFAQSPRLEDSAKQEKPSLTTPERRVPQRVERKPEEISADVLATENKIGAERTALNDVRAKFGLPPTDTSAAIDHLNTKRDHFKSEYDSQVAKTSEIPTSPGRGVVDPTEQPKTLIASETRLAKALTDQGKSFRMIRTANERFPEMALISQERRASDEPMIRVYRGVSKLDNSILTQTSYLSRVATLAYGDEARKELAELANDMTLEPSIEKLSHFVDAARTRIPKSESARLDSALAEIEDQILKGRSLDGELLFQQNLHLGGSVDIGLSPYISATTDPHEAASYGNAGILVISVPMSRVENLDPERRKEVAIRGNVDVNDYTAIIMRARGATDSDADAKSIDEVIQQMNDPSDQPNVTADSLALAWQQLQTERDTSRAPQRLKDIGAVRTKRIEGLIWRFRETGLSTQGAEELAQEEKTDVYTAAMRIVFDSLEKRLSKLKKAEPLSEYSYEKKRGAEHAPFRRDKVDEEMLDKLMGVVRVQERREEWR